MRGGEFRRRAEPSPIRVKALQQQTAALSQQGFIRLFGNGRGIFFYSCCNFFAGIQQPAPLLSPKTGYLPEQIHQPRLAIPALLGEIGAGKKRLLFRRHKNSQRPAARACHGLANRHINRINVRTFLTVNLDADIFLQQPGDLGVLKRFMGHHMAPMAGGITDA